MAFPSPVVEGTLAPGGLCVVSRILYRYFLCVCVWLYMYIAADLLCMFLPCCKISFFFYRSYRSGIFWVGGVRLDCIRYAFAWSLVNCSQVYLLFRKKKRKRKQAKDIIWKAEHRNPVATFWSFVLRVICDARLTGVNKPHKHKKKHVVAG